jgi:hypothetical protein
MASSISEALRRPFVFAVALFAATTHAPGGMQGARAEVAAPGEANRAAARAKLVEGVAALKRGEPGAALARFEEAYKLVPSPKIHYDFGLAYVGLGRQADAVAAFERFLAEAPDAPPDKRAKAASLAAMLRGQLAEAEAEAEARPAPIVVGSGPQPAGPPVHPTSPSETTALLSPGMLDEQSDEGVIVPAATASQNDRLRRRRIAAVAIGAAGAAFLTAGVVFGALAQREDDSLTRDSQMATATHPTPFDASKESRGLTYERLQIAGLAVGAVAVVTGTVLYAASRRGLVVEPGAGAALAGATVRGAF